MKKIVIVSALLLTLSGISAFAQPDACSLEFEEVGGGYYIYCNNPEAVDINTLVNGESPRYIMNNENLKPGKYYIYASHFNYIGTTVDSVAPAMELDVELNPGKDGCDFTLSNIGFETTEVTAWHENDSWVRYEQDWGMLNTCAKTMQKTIVDIDGEAVYPCGENEVYNVKANERVWLSQYISNYNKTHYMQPVHLQAILEIKSGTLDVNVCAFRSGDEVGDRSSFNENAQYGIKRHDKCVKGIANTLPNVAAELEYTIDDSDLDGTYLPVHMVNPYAEDGITLNEWFINLNPLDDPWAKAKADISGMLELEYTDDNKLSYYGANVPNDKKDNVWHIDCFHVDSHEYKSAYTTQSKNTYEPNFEIDASQNYEGYAMNLGNYGVTYTYNLSIRNNGNNTRYFTYAPTTNSNIIVYTNLAGEESKYALTKKFYAQAQQDVMSVVELLPGKTTKFSVNVTLPVNYNGGTKNAFIIRDKAEIIDAEELVSKTEDRVYCREINGQYLSEYKGVFPKETIDFFEGNLDAYEVVKFGDKYALRWCAWDGKYNYYYPGWWLCNHVYILNEDMRMETYYTFNSLPIGSSVSDDLLYIQTARNGIWVSKDGSVWNGISDKELPEYEAPEESILLGDISKEINAKLVGYGKYSKLIDQSEYEEFYNDIKDIELKKCDTVIDTAQCYGSILGENKIFFDGQNIIYEIGNGKNYFSVNQEDSRRIKAQICKIIFTEEREDYSEWSRSDVKLAGQYGFIPASLTSRKSGANITRNEFCDIAVNVIKYVDSIELPKKTMVSFSDSDSQNVRLLAQLGIITGYENGEFRPNNQITREEAAVVISRILSLFGLQDKATTVYSDSDEIQVWAKSAVDIVGKYGIMKGMGENIFSPGSGYTVEQSIVTMLRVFNTTVNYGYLSIPNIPDEGNSFAVYSEGYRNNRIELAVFDTETDSELIRGENGELFVSGSYKNDVKYYFSCGCWVEFEKGYDKISNNASSVLANGIDV